jgi:hypothetical protein
MAMIAFAAPILPGRTEEARRVSQEIQGTRRNQYEQSRQRLGITKEYAWIQETPQGALAIVFVEAENLEHAFQGLGASQDPFDVWFRSQVQNIYGLDLRQPGQIPEPLSAWEASSSRGALGGEEWQEGDI